MLNSRGRGWGSWGAKGYNTDYFGVLSALKFNGVEVKDRDCVVLGSGGASKSVVALLNDLGAKSIKIVSRTKKDINNGVITYIDYDELLKIDKSFLLVNTTPVGMSPNVNASPVSKDVLQKFSVCFDAVYNPIDTKLLLEAKELDIKTIDGLFMLVGQAISAFSIFNGIEVQNDDFFSIYQEVLEYLK